MSLPSGPTAPPIARIQQNVLAVGERHLLNWLCARMPRWVTPDLLTGFGMVGAFAIFAGYAASNWGVDWLWLAIAGYAIQWFGDSMDGSLARHRKIERPSYGYFIDHSCDGLATLLILAGMGASPYIRMDVALVALAEAGNHAGMVDQLDTLLFAGTLGQPAEQEMVRMLDRLAAINETPVNRAKSLVLLALASPEFAIQR